jgi:hypothetical protein
MTNGSKTNQYHVKIFLIDLMLFDIMLFDLSLFSDKLKVSLSTSCKLDIQQQAVTFIAQFFLDPLFKESFFLTKKGKTQFAFSLDPCLLPEWNLPERIYFLAIVRQVGWLLLSLIS